MGTSTSDLRRQAAALRRAADRMTLLRLRLSASLTRLADVEEPAAARSGAALRARWNQQEDVELGRVVAGLRSCAAHLETAATAGERASGRRMGGYQGAGFLGRGDEAVAQVWSAVHPEAGAQGALIGGFPLRPEAEGMRFLPQVSRSLGEPTPEFDDEA
ncbi:hypothetical protein ACXET9_02165 [Brachybacterium sp. DNPG3]